MAVIKQSSNMVYIGVDPSISSTGIAVVKDDPAGGDSILWATVNVVHTIIKKSGRAKEGRFIATFVDKPKCLYNPFPIKKTYPLEPNGNIRQVKVYYDLMLEVFQSLSKILAYDQKQSKVVYGLNHCKVGIEIPFGRHQGAAAKIDRIFAAVSLAVIHSSPLQIALGSWDVYEYAPHAIKKFISGKGNCKKDVVVKEVFKKFGFDTNIVDLADAFALAKLLEHKNNGGDSIE